MNSKFLQIRNQAMKEHHGIARVNQRQGRLSKYNSIREDCFCGATLGFLEQREVREGCGLCVVVCVLLYPGYCERCSLFASLVFVKSVQGRHGVIACGISGFLCSCVVWAGHAVFRCRCSSMNGNSAEYYFDIESSRRSRTNCCGLDGLDG